jgi:hypothetical protein
VNDGLDLVGAGPRANLLDCPRRVEHRRIVKRVVDRR